MKKNILYFAAFALTLGMASCSSDDTNNDDQTAQEPVVVELTPQQKPVVLFTSNGCDISKPLDESLSLVDNTPIEISGLGGSVEVNLALNDKKDDGDWKESHLSIHVRDTTNVTVFMPIDVQYYCQQDDMMIVKDHKNFTYKENVEEVTASVGGQNVTLTIRYRANGIEVSTAGINSTALKAMRKYYKDGITFEIKNYFRIDEGYNLTREQIKASLDNSYITFDREPKVYVNAFGKYNEVVDKWACVVKPQNIGAYNDPLVLDFASKLNVYVKK